VNVDFADVRTVMGEVGMAMMGSAMAEGADRARQAAEQAVRSPLLEDVNLAGARGVLVNVTASSGLRMREYQEVMTTIKEFTADDALVIVGTVIDDAMDDRLRVTMIATGLGGTQAAKREQRAPNMTLVEQPQVVARTGTDNVGVSIDHVDYQNFDAPAVIRRRERGGAAAPAIDSTEIPAFLRKQAD
jgi:cell division protein FtsZ